MGIRGDSPHQRCPHSKEAWRENRSGFAAGKGRSERTRRTALAQRVAPSGVYLWLVLRRRLVHQPYTRAGPPGQQSIDLYDFGVFAAQFAGPFPTAGDGGGGNGGGEAGAGGGGNEALQPSAEAWTHHYASLALELRPLGGRASVTVLAPNTTYEVHYRADYELVDGYIMFTLGVSPMNAGAEDGARLAEDSCVIGLFQFVGREEAAWHRVATPTGDPQGYCPYELSPADFWIPEDYAGADDGGSQGHLRNITTDSPGDLHLQLYAWWIDPSAYIATKAETQAVYVVAGNAANDADDADPPPEED